MKKILIVDDDKKMRALLREILSVLPYEVLEASNGQQAFDRLQKEPVDLLITDRSMPELGGLELLRRLRDANQSIPSIVISAYGEETFWAEAIGLGAEDYILKPFTNEDVMKIVRRKLG